ncbi:protein-glutamate O-methyltransferase [Silurus asotus]|uniref:Sugar phosphate phosphatase n=1 Tax=Silurus asotus TaxID=30991 RepID=A0AAD5AET4_SILAS|nr:protein-glutamate O-methyltransferase [Silurus asotus]
MAADQVFIPPPSLSAKFEGSFAYLTVRDRLPTILTKVIDTIHRTKNDFFQKHGEVSLWGNRCDLSISAGQENSQKTSPIHSLPDLRHFILVDDSDKVWSVLTSKQSPGGQEKTGVRLDIILDNAGFELVTDLVLADFMVSVGLAKEVHFHGKSIPWFVSDVTSRDFDWTTSQTAASNHKHMSSCGVQWKRHVKDGAWTYHQHPFWTLPHEFCDMPADAPDLYSTLRKSDLILFKGDLNYRRLTGDRAWEHTVPFGRALRGFLPAPLCSLRTLKANVQVGLEPGQAEKLAAQDAEWMTSGKYAVIQFCSPFEEQRQGS